MDNYAHSLCFFSLFLSLTDEPTTDGDCASPSYKSDGECDDENNVVECDYDGGDCCGAYVVTTWCNDCLCLDPGIYARTRTNTRTHDHTNLLFSGQ